MTLKTVCNEFLEKITNLIDICIKTYFPLNWSVTGLLESFMSDDDDDDSDEDLEDESDNVSVQDEGKL